MALWNEKSTPAPAGPVAAPPAAPPERISPERPVSDPALAVSTRRPTPKSATEGGESVIAANLTIEGKIEGSGNVRMAGRFKGDVRIDGNFNIEPGAHLTGQVLAGIVVVGGNCWAISSRPRGWTCRKAASSSATSRRDPSRSPPDRACADTSNSAGETKR